MIDNRFWAPCKIFLEPWKHNMEQFENAQTGELTNPPAAQMTFY